MKTRIKTEPKFIVKPEDKVVVCKMKVDMQLNKSECWDYIYNITWGTKAPMVRFDGKFIVTAKAKCDSEDTFDEVIGKRIAESKAKAKVFKIAKNVWGCIAKDLSNRAKIAEKMAENCTIVEEVEVRHITELSK
nr:MAG TPA: hypothetical protein [Caudoviricetes sp.]